VKWLALLLALAVAAPAAASAAASRKQHRIAPSHRVAKKLPKHNGTLVKRPIAAPHPSASPVPEVGGAPGQPAGGPAPAPTATPAPTPAEYPSRTRVILDDTPYSLTSSYNKLKAGPLEFVVFNAGEDDHNLTIDGVQGGTVFAPPDGEEQSLSVSLPPGSYRLYCSLLDHADRGMQATITVR
jgi:hypothetical protein